MDCVFSCSGDKSQVVAVFVCQVNKKYQNWNIHRVSSRSSGGNIWCVFKNVTSTQTKYFFNNRIPIDIMIVSMHSQ